MQGFSVLHDEALLPAYRGKPLVIKNTNNPDHPGTRRSDEFPVVGIAGDSGFVSINMSKYPWTAKLVLVVASFKFLEDLNIGGTYADWYRWPIWSLYVHENYPIKEEEILSSISSKALKRWNEHDLSIIMIVEKNEALSVTAKQLLVPFVFENNINIQMMSQGSSEVSIMFVQKTKKAAIKALYQAFFGESKED